MLVLAAGILWIASRHHEPSPEKAAAESAAHRTPPAVSAPAPSAVPLGSVPAPAPPAAATGAKPAAASLDEAEERNADPKLARARALEAAPLLVACRTAYQDARRKDAEAACLAARDANPRSAEANGFLAHALLNRGRRREALAAAELAVKLNQKWADPYAVIGTIHQDAGEMADARRAYQRYLELEPHGSYANELRAIVDRLGKL
jgi:Flp pilus assembly protein TadD